MSMASAPLLGRPEVSVDSNLPHGIRSEKASSHIRQDSCGPTDAVDTVQSFGKHLSTGDTASNYHDHVQSTVSEQIERASDYCQFSPGVSDDEESRKAFERSWPSHQAEKQAANAAKGKKSPRASDRDDFEIDSRAKKPRRSLFGRADEDLDLDTQVSILFAPTRPRHSLGNDISGLTLDQQEDGCQHTEGPLATDVDLASSDIGSVRASPAPSHDEPAIPPDTAPYYELRQNIDRQKAVTHVDSDKSGNFDPEQEAKSRAAKLLGAKAAKKKKRSNERGTRKKRVHARKDYVMKCIVKLPIDAFGNVRNITNDEQNWPDHWSEIDSEQEREMEEFRAIFRVRTPDHGLQFSQHLADPAGEVDDLIGHPAARGCKQCRKIKQPCSMVQDGKYPCQECTEDGSECQPIREPAVKGSCKQCDQTEAVCSFETEVHTQSICSFCAENNLICEALPPNGYKAPRINIEEISWGPSRSYIACTACRKDKRRCTLKTKEDRPPCQYCKTNNLGCTFYHLLTRTSASGKRTKDKTFSVQKFLPKAIRPVRSGYLTAEDLQDMDRPVEELRTREPTTEMEMEMEDGKGNIGTLTKITTSFAHPIEFSTQTATDSDCSFCEDPLFGIVGCFEREVDVIRWHNGRGFAEIGGGHCQNEGGRTAMCAKCTNSRLQIIVCPGHKFERMADTAVNHETFTSEAAIDSQYQLERCCSLCFAPAVYECLTVQPDLTAQEEIEISGCMLKLCAACEQALKNQHGGDFSRMISDMAEKPKITEADALLGKDHKGMPRADVGFLIHDGLLMQAVFAAKD